jgi:hypothetical protein
MSSTKSLFKPQGVDSTGAYKMDRVVAYVATANLPEFLQLFKALPAHAQVVLVTGLEDIGMPWEAWGFGRDEAKGIWAGKTNVYSKTMDGLKEFILDPRLEHWYAQNYDLVGCNVFSCSNFTTRDAEVVKKVSPIPIGVDFHSVLKNRMGEYRKEALQGSKAICKQQAEVNSVSQELPPFLDRPLKISAAFGCAAPHAGPNPGSRAELCALIKKHSPQEIVMSSGRKRIDFWRGLGKHAFSLAPPGHGQDTHRAWEVLNLGSVPIMVTSPLDPIYKPLPVIIVKSWSELFSSGNSLSVSVVNSTTASATAAAVATTVSAAATIGLQSGAESHLMNLMKSYREQILLRFGPYPFNNTKVREMLTINYWTKVVNDGRKI